MALAVTDVDVEDGASVVEDADVSSGGAGLGAGGGLKLMLCNAQLGLPAATVSEFSARNVTVAISVQGSAPASPPLF